MSKAPDDRLGRRRFLCFVPAACVAAKTGAGRAEAPDCFAFPPDPVCWAADDRLARVWRCSDSDCPGYDYDPLRGEYTQDIAPGTAFEELPRGFYCPSCGAEKSAFVLFRDRAALQG